MTLLTFYGGPADGRLISARVKDDIAFAENGVYEVVADMAFFTGHIIRITRSDVPDGTIIEIIWCHTQWPLGPGLVS
jgi:hypothetical protein